jgi:hypothetical protein
VSVLSRVSAISGVGGGMTAGREELLDPHATSVLKADRSSAMRRICLRQRKPRCLAALGMIKVGKQSNLLGHAIEKFIVWRESDSRILLRLPK